MSCAGDLRAREISATTCVFEGLNANQQHLSELQMTMTDEDAAPRLASASIASSTTLERLVLGKGYHSGRNIIGMLTEASWRVLLESVGKSVSLSEFCLAYNMIPRRVAIALGVALHENDSLQSRPTRKRALGVALHANDSVIARLGARGAWG